MYYKDTISLLKTNVNIDDNVYVLYVVATFEVPHVY